MLRFAAVAAVLGGLAVGLGAMAAHGLKARLTPDQLAWWKTGAEYHLIHALALLVTTLQARAPAKVFTVAAIAFAVGIALFSGSLYVMALTDVRALGAVTPFGGVAFIVGWGALAFGLVRARAA